MRFSRVATALVLVSAAIAFRSVPEVSADSGAVLGSTVESAASIITEGDGFTCWVDAGAAKCIGANGSGQLGNGTGTTSQVAVAVSGATSGIVAVVAGDSHACALTSGGGVKCWGANTNGQLGDGTVVNALAPVQPTGLSSGVIRIDADVDTTCAVKSNGSVLCWGNNQSYATGSVTVDANADSIFDPVLVPTSVAGIGTTAVSVSVGGFRASATSSVTHVCALGTYGSVWCWGSNASGELGSAATNPTATPVAVTLPVQATAVTAGTAHSCVVTDSSTVKCWGDNSVGQMATGGTTTVGVGTIADIPALSAGVVQVVASRNVTCTLTSSGEVKCWGDNIYSGIRVTQTRTTITTPEIPYSLSSGARAIALNGNTMCVLRSNGDLVCWGANHSGQVGDGYALKMTVPTAPYTSPGNSGPLGGITTLGNSMWTTCGVTSTGAVKCWGYGAYGNVGTGTYANSPVSVAHLALTSGVSSIVGGYQTLCAIKSDTTASCWGYNPNGQMATGDTTTTLTTRPYLALAATPLTGIAQMAASNNNTCLVTTGGAAMCAGAGMFGALGNGGTTASYYPVPVTGLTSGVSKVVLGSSWNACAILTDGTGKCWGNSTNGRLGSGSASYQSTPVSVSGLTGATDIAGGEDFTCALVAGGAAKCWGAGSLGQLGNGATSIATTPVSVSGLTGATKLFAGPRTMCALMTGGALKCWGWNYWGFFLDGTTNNSNVPVDVAGLTGVTDVNFGGSAVCIRFNDSTIKCWGSTQVGQVGNNVMESRPYDQDVKVATGLVSSTGLAPLAVLPTTTTTSTTVPVAPVTPAAVTTTTAPLASATISSSVVPATQRVDETVYIKPPKSLGVGFAVNIISTAALKTHYLVPVTPKQCIVGGRVVFAQSPGSCRVLIRSIEYKQAFDVWSTTIAQGDAGIGSSVFESQAIRFAKLSPNPQRGSLAAFLRSIGKPKAAVVVGHAALLTGETTQNLIISQHRARNVAIALRRSAPAATVGWVGLGSTIPLSRVLTEKTQAPNRRVVVYYIP